MSSGGRALRIVFAVLLALGVASLLGAFRSSAAAMDEGILLVYPALARQGATAGVDFLYPYGPGSLWVLAAAYRVLGTSVVVERLVGLAYRLLLVAALASLVRGRSSLRALSAAAIAVIVLTPWGITATAWFGGIAFLTASLAVAYGTTTFLGRSSRPLVAGLLSAFALTERPDLAVACLLSSAPYLRLADGSARRRWLAGLCVGLVPLALFVARAPGRIAYSTFVEQATRARAHVLPLPPRAPAECALFLLVVLVAATSFALGAYQARRAGLDADRAAGLARGLLSVALLPQMFQRADIWHIVYVGCVVLPLGVATACELAAAGDRLGWTGDEGSVVLLALLALSGATTFAESTVGRLIGLVGKRPLSDVVGANGRTFPTDETLAAEELGEMLRLLDREARAGDRLFVGARDATRMNYNDAFVYFLAPKLRPASYYVALVPGTSVPPAEVLRADFVLLSTLYDWMPASPMTPDRAELNRVLATDFCALGERGHYALRVRCNRSAAP